MNNNEKLEIQTKAPGKIIISGEHAVVYGTYALSLSIDLFTICKLHLEKNTGNTNNNLHIEKGQIVLNLNDINIIKVINYTDYDYFNYCITYIKEIEFSDIETILFTDIHDVFKKCLHYKNNTLDKECLPSNHFIFILNY